MGMVLGCADFYSWEHVFELNQYYFTNYCINCFYHGIDWMYSTVETIYSYDFRVWYFWFFNSVYDESFDFFFNTYWYFSLNTSSFQLFWGIILDSYVVNTLIKLPYTEEWFKSMLSSKEATLVLIHHPELCFLSNTINDYYYTNYLTNYFFSLYELVGAEGYQTAIMLFPQLVILIFAGFIFMSFFFSYFTHTSKEGLIIDADYLVSNSSVEAEKEISSYDDMILGIVVLCYVFGWYFYIQFWSMFSMFPELGLLWCLFPGLYFIIVGIPTALIYDFGIFFLAYLKGVGTTPVLIFELVYDFIAVVIFYTRILVQGVRLILMLFTYASMHDLVLYFSFDQTMFLGAETFWEELNGVSLTLDSITYFMLFIFPSRLMYWIYEILHTFFVVTVQFAAFFAIVFWLFLFLYTFFVMEKQEAYYIEKRIIRKKQFEEIIGLK